MRNLAILTIIALGAFTGNMINIGLSYGIHWLSLEPVAFMETFATDFPLLLGPTAVTLLPAFLGTVFLYFASKKGSSSRKLWLYTLIGLLIINIQTTTYHLPLNLDFVSQSIELDKVSGKLSTWMVFHWVRVILAVISCVLAILAFEKESMKRSKHY